MKASVKGYLCAAVAAAAYGTNPAFAVPLYEQGMNPSSVLLFRYVLGLPLLMILAWVRGQSLRVGRGEIGLLAVLGVMMALSSLTLFESYCYMNSGVASALLFVYPVMVAVMMIFFFHEKFKASTAICLLLMSVGVTLLVKNSSGQMVSMLGCALVMLSALTYAVYLVMVNVSKPISRVSTTKLMFYVLLFGSLVFVVMVPFEAQFTVPERASGWLNLLALAVIPTVLSLMLTTRAIQLIGSTPTAILGALEPVSAIVLSVLVLQQGISLREVVGCCFIVVATLIVISNSSVERVLLRMRKMFPRRRKL